MATKTLAVKLPEDLYHQLIETVTDKKGPWRSQSENETFNEAVESAVTVALMLFLQGLDGKAELPELRDYILEKYPELDEDLITMMEDLIKRQKELAGAPKPRTIHSRVTPEMAREIGKRIIKKKHPHFFY